MLYIIGLLVALVNARCDTHALAVHTQQAEASRARVLEPLLNSAVLMSRSLSSPASVRIHFAHRLARVHDVFAADCMDNEWSHALAHKICASFIRWAPELSNLTEPMCALHSLDLLLAACRAHIEPWSKDAKYCASLPLACADRTPLWGACELWGNTANVRDTHRGMHHKNRSHARHGTRVKHTTQAHAERAHSHLRLRKHMADRLQNPVNRVQAQASSQPHPTDPATVAALYKADTRAWDLRSCASLGRVVCVPVDSPRLKQVVQKWLPGCEIRSRQGNMILQLHEQECGTVVVWAPVAETMMRWPCLVPPQSSTHELATWCTSREKVQVVNRWLLEPSDHVYTVQTDSDARQEFDRSLTDTCKRLPPKHRTTLVNCK
jgi:hypothetical protein